MRSIGIPVANRPECIAALDFAFALGRSLNADVVGYHIRPNRRAAKDIDLLTLLSRGDNPWPLDSLSDEKQAAQSAQELFGKFAASNGYEISKRHGTEQSPRALFREKVGAPNKVIPLFGPVSDLLVVSRPNPKSKNKKAAMILMTSLMNSTTPVLVLPQKRISPEFKRLAIAWNRGKSETLLVHSLLPLLKTAEDIVFISEGVDHQEGASAQDMITYLKAHGIKARRTHIQTRNTGEGLVKTARDEKADVLLGGAYTRGRKVEILFGGVTEYLLTSTDFPVILMHS